VLLSGLVFPGLGQLVSGHPWRGLAFALGTVAGVVVVLRRVAREAFARIPEDPTSIDPLLPFRLAHEIQSANASFFFWLTAILLAIWVGSIVDAWRTTTPWSSGTGGPPTPGGRGPRPSSDRPQ
jgi:F0F1-type ATP synthase assembly protein I